MRRSIHIEAPVDKVFDFMKDPRNTPEGFADAFAIKDVKLTEDGVGSYYSWASKTPVLRYEGFDVYTEFIPNQRITDRSSSGLAGDHTLAFEPEGSGTKLTVETHRRSFWGFPPLRALVDLGQGAIIGRFLSAVKAEMEA